MARRIRKVSSRRRLVTFKVTEDFFRSVDKERKRVFEKTGVNLTQPAISNIILRNTKMDFLNGVDMFNGIKKRRKKK